MILYIRNDIPCKLLVKLVFLSDIAALYTNSVLGRVNGYYLKRTIPRLSLISILLIILASTEYIQLF